MGSVLTYVPGVWTGDTTGATALLLDASDNVIHTFTFGSGDTYTALSSDLEKTLRIVETHGEQVATSSSIFIEYNGSLLLAGGGYLLLAGGGKLTL